MPEEPPREKGKREYDVLGAKKKIVEEGGSWSTVSNAIKMSGKKWAETWPLHTCGLVVTHSER